MALEGYRRRLVTCRLCRLVLDPSLAPAHDLGRPLTNYRLDLSFSSQQNNSCGRAFSNLRNLALLLLRASKGDVRGRFFAW